VIFLAGDPVRWAAPDRRRHRVARVAVECNPCEHLVCPIDHRCATRLPAERVAAEALDLVATPPDRVRYGCPLAQVRLSVPPTDPPELRA